MHTLRFIFKLTVYNLRNTNDSYMTDLLKKVIAEIEKLPEESQDAIAARLIADLNDELEWANRFAATTDSQWNKIAEMAQREINAGEIKPLDDLLSSPDDKS